MSSLVATWLWGGSDGTNQVRINEGSGWVTLSLTNPRSAVEWWLTLAGNATVIGSLAGTYTGAVDPTTGYVTLSSTVSFDLELMGSLPSFFGFASGALGSATSHTSSSQPLGLYALPGVTYTAPKPLESTDLRDYRYGRATAYSYWQGEGTRIEVYGETATIDAMLAGPTFNGTMTVYPDITDSAAFSSTNTDGTLIVAPMKVVNVETFGAGDSYRRVVLDCVRREAGLTIPSQGLPRLASGLPFGWRFMYAMKIEGIEHLFTEADTGAANPAGYAIEPTLVIDGSASVGSRASRGDGIGVGFDLVFRLQRSATLVDLMKRPTFAARITSDVHEAATGIVVDDTTGLTTTPPGTTLWLGTECIGTCYATSGTVIAGLTRGQPAGEWRSFAVNGSSAIGTYVTDKPLLWRGRQLKLYAVPVDPFGVVHGADALTDAVMVWRGTITTDPRPDHDGFVFNAQTDDRKLSRDLGVGTGGRGRFMLDADPVQSVDTDTIFSLEYLDQANSESGSTEVQPFSGLSSSERLSTLRGALVDAINSWFSSSGFTNIMNARWVSETTQEPFGGFSRRWYLWVEFQTPSASLITSGWRSFSVSLVAGSADWIYIMGKKGLGYGGSASTFYAPVAPDTIGVDLKSGFMVSPVEVDTNSITVELDDVDAASIPSTGAVFVEAGQSESSYLYTAATANGATVTLTLDKSSGPPLSGLDLADADALNEDFAVTFVYADSGDPRDMMRRMLMSSGRGDNDATYDTLAQGYGYDLANVDTDSFDQAVDGMWRTLNGDLRLKSDVSFASVFGKLLGLSGRAVVLREEADGSDHKLAVVRMTLYDTAGYVTTITDDHVVLSASGVEPVRVLERDAAPNSVRVDGEHAGNEFSVVVNDIVSQQAEGSEVMDLSVRGFSRLDLAGGLGAPGVVPVWARALFAERFGALAYEIDVVPWVPVRVGDAVYLDIGHYAMFQRETGAQGYTGVARVVGKRMDLATGVVTLTVYVQGAFSNTSLCPSAEVRAYTGTPGAPTVIKVGLEFLELFQQHLEGGNQLGVGGGVPFQLMLHDPGNAVEGSYWIDDVYESGGLTFLKVSIVGGTPTMAVGKHLTVPHGVVASERQNLHLHTDTEGGVWS